MFAGSLQKTKFYNQAPLTLSEPEKLRFLRFHKL